MDRSGKEDPESVAPRGLLIDLDGVVYVGDDPLPGAARALERLRERGMAVRFLTNTSTRPVAAVEEKLARIGVRVEPGEVVGPVGAALRELRKAGARAPYLVVDERIAGEFAGISPAGAFPGPPARPPDWIVVGDIGGRWDYELMNALFAMMSAGARLLALHKTRAWQTADGLRLDIGAFVAGLEYASGAGAVVAGKPSAGFFHAALESMACRPEEAIMVGDDVESDVGGAQAAGIRGVLVRTGKYREELAARSAVRPWRIIDSFARIETVVGADSRR